MSVVEPLSQLVHQGHVSLDFIISYNALVHFLSTVGNYVAIY